MLDRMLDGMSKGLDANCVDNQKCWQLIINPPLVQLCTEGLQHLTERVTSIKSEGGMRAGSPVALANPADAHMALRRRMHQPSHSTNCQWFMSSPGAGIIRSMSRCVIHCTSP